MEKRSRPRIQTLDAEAAAGLLQALEEQAELARREAAKAGDLNRSLQYQYLLGVGAGLTRAAAMVRAAGDGEPLQTHKPAA
jgi:hypothetical protein